MVDPYSCPKCKSNQTQKASVIYSAGTSTSTGLAGGAAVGIDIEDNYRATPIIGGGLTRSTQQSALAQQLKPPEPNMPSDLFALLGLSVVYLLFLGLPLLFGLISLLMWLFPTPAHVPGTPQTDPPLVFSVLGMVIAVVCLFGPIVAAALTIGRKSNARYGQAQQRHQDEIAEWERTMFCHRCGATFQLPATLPATDTR